MSGDGQDGPGESRQTLAEPEDERDGLPRLGVPGEQEPVCGGSQDDHLDRREDRRGQRGKGKRRPRPRLESRGKAGESNDVAPIPREGRNRREGEHKGDEREKPETPCALFARLRSRDELYSNRLLVMRFRDDGF